MDVNDNQLSGELSNTISSFSDLVTFSVYANDFSGNVPRDFGKNSRRLSTAKFSKNRFFGELPPELCTGFALQILTVGNNRFTGPLPECLRNCSRLTRARFGDNKFTANITNAFGVYPELVLIDLSGNQFVGEISKEWGESRNLTNLQMERNKLSGRIPPELGKLSRLQRLRLDSNDLTGEIPAELGNLGRLYELNLSDNHLFGEIPQRMSYLAELESLDLSANNFSGKIPKGLANCERLSTLKLSHNNLSGEIPSELGNFVYLQGVLDLSSNSLSVEIPSSFFKLKTLEILNLSHNHLSGAIPLSLSQMVSLRLVDFSYNNLTGTVPSIQGFFKDPPVNAFVGNPGLCGNVAELNPCRVSSSNKTSKILNSIRVSLCTVVVLAIFVSVMLVSGKSRLVDAETESPCKQLEISEPMIWEKAQKFTFKEIVNATENFHDKYCIGKGGFGIVYKAVLSSGVAVAVNRMNTGNFTDMIPETNRLSFKNEIRILMEVRHQNIVRLYGFCSRRGYMHLVYEYVERGSLGKVLYGLDDKEDDDHHLHYHHLGWDKRLRIVQGLAQALSYLHHDCSPQIVHRDVSLNNILLDWDYEPRLADFGTAKLVSTESSNWTPVAGSYGYMAPGNC